MSVAYHQPRELKQALGLIAEGAIPLAGATSLFAGLKPREGAFVDISLLGLDQISVSDEAIDLGAGLTLSQIAQAQQLPGMPGAVLRRCARGIATPQLRNMITLGGNIAQLVYWEDMPVVLLALDAAVRTHADGHDEQEVLLGDALAQKQPPWKGGLITSVRVPVRKGVWGFGYHRFTKTVTDYPLANACVTMRVEQGVAKNVRVVCGAVSPRAARLGEVEALLEGNVVDDALVAKAKGLAKDEVVMAPNHRAPADYRRKLAGVLVGRAISDAWLWATRGE